jgi:hypothetical protein
MKLRARALGLSIGTVWGLAIFLATLWAAIEERGLVLELLKRYYIGYSVSFGGALVGLIWGFVYGFVFGALVAWLYNIFHKVIYKSVPGGA